MTAPSSPEPTWRIGSLIACDVARACDRRRPGAYARLPFSLRILAENIARSEPDVERRSLALEALISRSREVDLPFRPARVVLQDLLGTPALVDLAGMRNALAERGGDPRRINPVVPVHLVVDHSLNVEHWGDDQAKARNLVLERARNSERFAFLSWCSQAFNNLSIIPSGTGILHQINLERLTPIVATRPTPEGIEAFYDTLVGTDSHTTMINALGVLGWGVGGIEAEAAMLGEPLILRLPETVGVRLLGEMPPGTLATDVVLALTETLRQAGVIGAFVEFFGAGLRSLALADRATIANMAPEFGATTALFAPDDRTLDYLRLTGRSPAVRSLARDYAQAQQLWADSLERAEYDRTILFDLSAVRRAIAGPKHPHQRIPVGQVPDRPPTDRARPPSTLPAGAIVIAAITACTNTSNPRAVIAAALLARKARRRGLTRAAWTKTSFAPGSRVVADYLSRAGLDSDLDALGFNLVGFGCTTCNGMSGPLPEEVAEEIRRSDIAAVAVLSGNRNFEGRIHPLAREAFIMSPPLVVAYAIAGRMHLDLERDALAHDSSGAPVYLRELWPSDAEIAKVESEFVTSDLFSAAYAAIPEAFTFAPASAAEVSPLYAWDSGSSYLRRPPYWDPSGRATDPAQDLQGMRPLAMLGDHITTDHLSPSGAILAESVAGRYLIAQGIDRADFNSYGTRRGNHEVGMRATMASPRLRNELIPGVEGSFTLLMPEETITDIFAAAETYARRGQPLLVIAGREYGSGSSRDWAAKGPRLLGVRVVLAESFERIHRSNLAGVGVLPVEFMPGTTRITLGLTGRETFDLRGVTDTLAPGSILSLVVCRENGEVVAVPVRCRLDTYDEIGYFRSGGLLRHLLERQLVLQASAS